MSGIAFAALLTAFSTGQVEPGYWQQWNQSGPFEIPGNARPAGPLGWVNGQPGQGYESWDWRLDPFRGTRPGLALPAYPRRVVPIQPARGRYRGPGSLVRQSLSGLDADSPTLRSYRKALDAMRRLPADDPHSLIFQANIHGYMETQSPDPTWGQCQHGNWWFLPWHRAYLHCFEKIVRRYAEDPSFALPYWDYGAEQARALPVPFRDPASELYDGTRRPAVNNGTDRLSAGIVVDGLSATMTSTVFADFGQVSTFGGQALRSPQHLSTPHGVLEAVPHDLVHGFVGGDMGAVETAARDPLFFCHHANIDRLWEVWLQMGQGRANPSDNTWLNQRFTFYDENKRKFELTIRDVVDIGALGYSYGPSNAPPGPAPTPSPTPTPTPPTPTPTPTPSPTPRPSPPTPTPTPSPTPRPSSPSTPAPDTAVDTVASINTSNVALQDRPVTLAMEIPQGARGRFRRGKAGTRASGDPRIFLQLHKGKFVGVPDSVVAVYVNLPSGSPIPGPHSGYFAGYFTFFGDHHHQGYASQVDVTRQLQRQWQTDTDQRTQFTVTLVRLAPGVMPRDFRAPITFREMSLTATK